MASLLRSALVFAFASSLIVLAAPACSEQAEGERCDRAKAGGDSECDAGLICVPQSELLEDITDLCCPPEGQESTSRCTRKGSSGSSGSSNGGSSSSGSNAGGTAAGEPPVSAAGEGGAGGTSGSAGTAGEPAAGGSPTSEGGAPGAAGNDSSAGAPLVTGGQAGSP